MSSNQNPPNGYLEAQRLAEESKRYGTAQDTRNWSWLDRQTYLKNGGK